MNIFGWLTSKRTQNEQRYATVSEASGDKVGLDVNLVGGTVTVSGTATAAKQDEQTAELQDINTAVTNLAAEDFATETTLAALAAEDFATETTLASIDGKDFATETTLASLEGKDFATQTTLASLEGKDFATETTLASLEGKDFATQTTLASLEGKDFATETTLASLAAEDFATETTLASLAAEDFATETTLAALAAEDFATETTLDEIKTELEKRLTWKAGARIDASSANITTGAYSELIGNLSAACEEIEIYNGTTQTLRLARGAASSEVEDLYIPPYGNGRVPYVVASSTRLSVIAEATTATTGELIINLYGV